MPNALTASGLTTSTRAELVEFFTEQYQSIYGLDINLSSDTPDGQMMNIFIQSILDLQDFITSIYNSFDPDKAFGITLDARIAINGIKRLAGTRTITNVTIVTTEAITLYGTDQDAEDIYTVADDAGNNWQLITTTVLGSPGSNVLAFQSEKIGRVLTIPNTITVPVTIVLGVDSINNPTSYTTLGIDEELDEEVKIRRQKSVSLSSQGYLAGLIAALSNINGLTTVKVYENVTAATDGDGIPAHSIWVIVGGTAENSLIANAIYKKRNGGCGMKGSQTYLVTQADGSDFAIKWDVIATEDLYTKFTVAPLDDATAPDIASIRSGLITKFIPGLYEKVNANTLADKVREIDSNALVTSAGFSTSSGGTYTASLLPSAKNKQFTLTSARVIILPLLLYSTNSVVAVAGGIVVTTLSIASGGANEQLNALGGYGTYTWTKTSGSGSITGGGLYTPPGAPGSAVVRATDALGNYTEMTITVT